MRKLAFIILFLWAMPTIGFATVLVGDTFDSYGTSTNCDDWTGGIVWECWDETTSSRNGIINIVSSIPGSSASFPSGSRCVRFWAKPYEHSAQAISYIAPSGSLSLGTDFWMQVAIYYQSYGGGTPGITPENSHPANEEFGHGVKIFYPNYNNRGWFNITNYTYNVPITVATYHVDADTCTWSPHCEPNGASNKTSNLINNGTSSNWGLPNQWCILKWHICSTAGSKVLEAWIDRLDGNGFSKVMSYTGADTGYGDNNSFTGNIQFILQVPASGASSTWRDVWVYFDDIYFTTTEGDLPTYGGDTTPPTITNVTSDKTNGSYKAGEVIDIDVIFSEAVTSTGNVTVTLETGDTDRTCTFTVSGATTGTCNYTVQAGDTSGDLTVKTIAGTIKDAAENEMVDFAPATNLAANKAIIIDTTAPTILNVSSDKANGTYGLGTTIDIDVTFSEAVTSTGNVTVTLETGDVDRTCTFTVSAETTGTCNYVVQAGDSSADLTVKTIAGTINDAALNAMSNFTPGTNLAANKNLVIDSTNPAKIQGFSITGVRFQ